MKTNALKNTLGNPWDSILPEKIPLSTHKNFDQIEDKLAEAYPTTAEETPAIVYKPIVKLTVEAPAELIKAIKLKCLHEGITLKQYVLRVLEKTV